MFLSLFYLKRVPTYTDISQKFQRVQDSYRTTRIYTQSSKISQKRKRKKHGYKNRYKTKLLILSTRCCRGQLLSLPPLLHSRARGRRGPREPPGTRPLPCPHPRTSAQTRAFGTSGRT